MYVFRKLLKYEFSSNYNHLLSVSTNITSRNKKVDQKFNLLHEVYVSVYNRLDNHYVFLKSETDFVKYFTRYLKQYYEWSKQVKHRDKKDNTLFTYQPTEDEVKLSDFYDQVDDKAEQIVYIEAENTNTITKLFLKDMLLNDIPLDKGFLVNKIKDVAKNFLDAIDYQIFDLYYLQEMNCREIYTEFKKENDQCLGYKDILARHKTVKNKIIENLKW